MTYAPLSQAARTLTMKRPANPSGKVTRTQFSQNQALTLTLNLDHFRSTNSSLSITERIRDRITLTATSLLPSL